MKSQERYQEDLIYLESLLGSSLDIVRLWLGFMSDQVMTRMAGLPHHIGIPLLETIRGMRKIEQVLSKAKAKLNTMLLNQCLKKEDVK